MRIIIAPDSFKECLSAREVAAAMAKAARKVCPDADVIELPLADGGEGTVDILTSALGGTLRFAGVSDALGRPVTATYGVVEISSPPPGAGAFPGAADGFPADFTAAGSRGRAGGALAIIEAAQACGLERLRPEERNPLVATSRGVGELILAAYVDGCRRFIIGLGGSATCDGGEGMLSVPGIKDVLRNAEFEILCDVDAPFVGPNGAARMYAPQKGASPEDVEILERRMQEHAAAILRETGRDIAAVPGAGAAGGLGGAFLAYADATLSPGVDRVLDLVGFDAAILGHAPFPEGVACHCAPGSASTVAPTSASGIHGYAADWIPAVFPAAGAETDAADGFPAGFPAAGAPPEAADGIQAGFPAAGAADSDGYGHGGHGSDREDLLVVTGEGRSDRQTLQGKLPLGVLRRVQALARRLDGARPSVVLVSGRVEPEVREALLEAGFTALVAATPVSTPRFKALSPYFTKQRLRICVDIALHKIDRKI